ncbi:hypothetical protein BD309DRAFT_967722 [Dichomitus squalens]|uniref:Uncharacterized protein n=1 Tax=Dichomitus squalens TaxID=114155 RepID=A0A4Q9NGN0_9APHY|nr:hypothetical protein BD309DRAFT_967722 [Dichomitus squalens]TBU62798.1 hypothetical protein BD310DRAFT_918203 [Dichomitus squalens]
MAEVSTNPVPGYSDTQSTAPEDDPDLPTYSARSRAQFTEQTFQLEDTKSRGWLWLKVNSRSKANQLPLFYDRDTLSGTVEIDFDKVDGAKTVTVSVFAGVTAVGQEEVRFLEITHQLWSAKGSPKLPGKHSYPYAITLPSDASVVERGKKPARTFPLPPSFSERASPAYIDYKLVVTVKKGSFRVNQVLATTFVYMPLIRADPPSPLRELSYREGVPLIGPQGDPGGWKVFPSVKVAGTLFDTRTVELECTLAFATPLSYALGSPIPITLTLKGSDEQGLDLLSTPSAVRLRLIRVRLVGSHAILDDDSTGRSNNMFRDSVGSAFFWLSDEGAPEAGVRVLQGELEVKNSLKLPFVFPRFSVRYALVLLQFQAPGFAPASSDVEPLISERVTITGLNAPGVVPRSYAPPGYVHAEEGDYNTAMGYLENGNQRFYHHHGF